MKRLVRAAGAVLLVTVLGVAGFLVYLNAAWPIRAPIRTIDVTVERTPERVARGKQLVSLRCALCHYDQNTVALTGRRVPAEPPEFGTNYSHNITRHPTKGSGRYSDGELIYLLRTGIERDGIYSGPYMISPFLADEDLKSIVAFLRSDDPWVASNDATDRQSQPSLLVKFLFRMVIDRPAYPEAPIPVPNVANQGLGRYLVLAVGDCYVCHSRSFPTLNAREPEKSADFMGGGNELRDATGVTVRGANLTRDPETGIGKWSQAEFVRAVRVGVRRDGRVLRFPMLAYSPPIDRGRPALGYPVAESRAVQKPTRLSLPGSAVPQATRVARATTRARRSSARARGTAAARLELP
jgi:hypothetical protein